MDRKTTGNGNGNGRKKGPEPSEVRGAKKEKLWQILGLKLLFGYLRRKKTSGQGPLEGVEDHRGWKSDLLPTASGPGPGEKDREEEKKKNAGPLMKVFHLIIDSAMEWSNDNVTSLGAALAYYTIFSLPPILVIAVAIAGAFWGAEAASGQITQEFQGILGPQGGKAVEAMIARASQIHGGIAALVGVVFLILTATSVVMQLQQSLNTVWKVKPVKKDIKTTIKIRSISVAVVLGVIFVLLISLMINTLLSALGGAVISSLGGPHFFQYIFKALDFLVSLGIITVLFALLFRVLPQADVAWNDVWLGGFFTAVLFVIGKFVIGIYLGHSSVSTGYGAASSLAIILVWVYYSSMIFYFGAEFTWVYANRFGSKVRPAEGAVPA